MLGTMRIYPKDPEDDEEQEKYLKEWERRKRK